MGNTFYAFAEQGEDKLLEGVLCIDHVHMSIAISPNYSVAQRGGFIKRKSKIYIAGKFKAEVLHFKASGRVVVCFNLGRDEKAIREYIRKQEQENKRIEQLRFSL